MTSFSFRFKLANLEMTFPSISGKETVSLRWNTSMVTNLNSTRAFSVSSTFPYFRSLNLIFTSIFPSKFGFLGDIYIYMYIYIYICNI